MSLVSEARAAGLELRVEDDGQLTDRGPRAAEALARRLLNRKADVVAALTQVSSAPKERWPIIPGHEHFSIWVDSADGPWPEFIPGYHWDSRQPSRLRPLLAPKEGLLVDTQKTNAQDAPGIAPTGRVDV